MKMHVLVGALLFSTTGYASAADPVMPNKAPTAFNWTGAYAGIHLGYSWGASDFIDSEYNGAPPFPTVRWSMDSDGLIAGVQGGYNWQSRNLVYGLEAELGYLDLRGAKFPPGTDPVLGDPYDAAGTIDGDWYGGLSARLGYALDRTLLFGKAGLVYSGAEAGFLDTCTVAPCGNGMINASEEVGFGYQIGGGVEYAVADNWTLKAEYAYFDFGNASINGTGVGGGVNGREFNIGTDLSVHTVKIGLNYKF